MGANNNMSGKDFLIGALTGAIVGAAAALLLAPKSGKELRVDLTDGYHTATKKTQEIAKNVGEKSEYLVGKVKEAATNVKEDLQNLKATAIGEAKDVAEDVKDSAEDVKEEVAATIDKAKSK
ncbi:YtxH domain-containing protein [Bacillus horti]|uniref:Gas vesicle protein n=1 Tax=Caldalkalibacillus horti TaxID=77523 RepID=A0ABT9W0K3_9BACI|nr:YtxH domain-containing protein [Bacillus horti]MDQ0166769.1 gas vesicle protein [Bacillus horti]